MASKPSYDPNQWPPRIAEAESASINELIKVPGINLNQNVSGPTGELLAPGSVFKLVDTAAALASGKYNADSVLPNPARVPFHGIDYRLPNYAGGNCYTRDTASFAFALQQSCNTPFASIALDLGRDAIAEQAQKFGFGEDLGDQLKLGLRQGQRLPGRTWTRRASPSRPSARRMSAPRRCRSHMMTSAIANDGVQMRPKPDQDPALSGPAGHR